MPGLLCSVLLGLLAGAAVVRAAPVDGARVYREKCADCHGAKGEGVEGKYRDALYGDWALAKLTRYIAKNMPDDDPETLTAPEAEAVSRHVYDAFYSRSAQARNHPSRVELAHLTGAQYVLAVSDIVGRLERTDVRSIEAPGERGLGATYYSVAQRGRFDAAKLVSTGVDAAVDFTFAAGTPDRARVEGLEQFSMQWRGAVLAEETGDFEFVVRTPNSVRVWINTEFNPADALIDANVSRPDQPDHRVTVRLHGGRWYPLGIDYWALPGKADAPPPAIALRWKPPHGSERTIPARNLRNAKVRPTFVPRTHFPADDSSRGYERSGPVSKAWDDATTRGAFEVAAYVARHVDRLAGTRAGDPERARKIARLAGRFVALAFRRPLTEEEQARYAGTRFEAEGGAEAALQRTVLLALKSPHFLYTELPGDRPPAARVAARLALALWDSIPDGDLDQAAAAGRLKTSAEVAAQAERMLGDPRARWKLREFFHHWLQLRYVEDLGKDAAVHPDFTPGIIDDLRTSLDLFLADAAWSGPADLRRLLRADTLYVNDRLAAFYGLPAPAAGEFVPVPMTDGQRSGVLTHPYVLAAFSYKSTSSPIHRGVFLTRSIAGRALKSPPMAVAFDETEFSPEMTMREKVAKLTRSETCQGCHAVINPLGFTLEWFDAVGRFRREEKGRPVDASSEYRTDENEPVRLAGPRDVAEFAIGSEQASLALVEQLFHHVVKQPVLAYGPETLPRLRDSFVASGWNLPKLLVEIATVAALRGIEPPLAAAHLRPQDAP